MTLYELLQRRRSCRKFLPQKVDKAIIEKLISGAMTAPSSKNSRSTRLAVVQERSVIERLGAIRTYGSAFVRDAPLVILVMADRESGSTWVENCSISATVLQLLAEELTLGSCWVQVNGRPHADKNPDGTTAEEYIHELIPRTKAFRIECMVALGYPAADPIPRKEYDDSDKVIYIG